MPGAVIDVAWSDLHMILAWLAVPSQPSMTAASLCPPALQDGPWCTLGCCLFPGWCQWPKEGHLIWAKPLALCPNSEAKWHKQEANWGWVILRVGPSGQLLSSCSQTPGAGLWALFFKGPFVSLFSPMNRDTYPIPAFVSHCFNWFLLLISK